MKTSIAIAVSGGIDSLVAAYLLKKSHGDLIGIHFSTGYENQPGNILALEDQLRIPIHQIDLGDEFQEKVIDYFTAAYLQGITPNPCLVCNRHIKFGSLMKAARDLGADCLATGHYAGIRRIPGNAPALVKGLDPLKEQSYFLSMLTGEQLKHSMFPLADLTKAQVRQIALEQGLVPNDKKESQDICFMHNRSVDEFISARSGYKPRPGDIVLTDGTCIGKHTGLVGFTIGQRRGINCPGPRPYYVAALDTKANRLVVGFKEDLLKQSLVAANLHFPAPIPDNPVRVTTKIRYSHPGAPSLLTVANGTARVLFDQPQNAVTPGQAAVFYDGDRVLGAGIIQ